MNVKAQEVHALNRERMLRERAAMAARLAAGTVPKTSRTPKCQPEQIKEMRERRCLHCRKPFMSEGPHHRMCCACAHLPEGFHGL